MLVNGIWRKSEDVPNMIRAAIQQVQIKIGDTAGAFASRIDALQLRLQMARADAKHCVA